MIKKAILSLTSNWNLFVIRLLAFISWKRFFSGFKSAIIYNKDFKGSWTVDMDAYHLSQRLQTVAGYVLPGARLADIGSDHAYLPANLALNGKIATAIAGEVVTGPFENAVQEIHGLQLEKKIHVRQADGLAAIHSGEVIDVITICGMGGSLICQILAAGFEQLGKRPRLILQPNVNEAGVRKWLEINCYQIVAEEIIAEAGHIYEIIVADPTATAIALSEKAKMFGPLLLQERSAVFLEKWQQEQIKLQHVLKQMQQAQTEPLTKERLLQQKINMIEEVLHD
jgi:tRNA (adenine22-N1)-methyltransferase